MLSLKDIRKELPFHINRGLGDYSVNRLIRRYYEIDYDVFLPSKGKNLQRPFVWTLEQKQELILSIIKGQYIGKFTFISLDHKVLKVIDGKQRLSTILDFVQNKFMINLLGTNYYYNELPKDIQQVLWLFDCICDVGYEYSDKMISDDDKIAWFELINFTGTPQDKQHLEYLKT